ncbi:VHL beta domain-containing protein [Pontiella desulfatans]|uniref:VHL beta domain-containing protein n=1 Tax=Pontiella desulfatans TaxID=2750659 RepID=UPI00109BF73F
MYKGCTAQNNQQFNYHLHTLPSPFLDYWADFQATDPPQPYPTLNFGNRRKIHTHKQHPW